MRLSIICPTIYQTNENGEVYMELLHKQLAEQAKTISEHFEWHEIIEIPNRLVNEAWNFGAKAASGEILLFLNDDLLILEDIYPHIARLKEGEVFCPYFTRKDNFHKVHSDNGNNIVGFCFAVYKSDWKDIPEELKLWYGDNYVYERMKRNIVWGGNIHHWESRSMNNPEKKAHFDAIIEEDKKQWELIKPTIYGE